MSEARQLDFTGEIFSIGLDVHKQNWSVAVRSKGMSLKRFRMDPDPVGFHRFLCREYPGGEYRSVYEAGFCGFWIHRRLESLGISNVVANPADVPTSDKEKNQKTDKRDAGKLARELENGSLTGIYVPSPDYERLRSLCRLRHRLSGSLSRVKNRIKGHLHYYGVELPRHDETTHWSNRFLSWLDEHASGDTPDAHYLQHCLSELRHCRGQILDVQRQLRDHIRDYGLDDLIRRLKTVPGIGILTAITLCVEIMDIKRFKDLDHLASFVGLVPSTHSSGDKESRRGLTYRRNSYLRHMLIEAAWMAIRKDPAMLMSFNKLTRRMKKQLAIIRIARKLLNRIRYVWKNGKDYVPAVIE